jgi:pyruvate dehydrogenase E1 component alpha subunit
MLPDLPADQLRALLRSMLLIRRFEERLIELSTTTDIGHFHVYVGQEPTGVPVVAQLEDGDLAFSTHRNHGHLLARGADPTALYAEILGRATGTNHGKGGTLHLADRALGFPTTSASVGGPLPIAAGAALGFRELGRDRISVCLFGDGALEEGAWHEAANIAALRALPVIFVCENNSLEAIGQRANEYPSSTLATADLTRLCEPFGIPAVAIDGTDVGAAWSAMQTAVDRARAGDGPTFIEARTVRWPGSRPLWPSLVTGATDVRHAWDRTAIPEQHAAWHSAQDGVLGYVRDLVAAGAVDHELVLAMDAEVTGQIADALREALDAPWPDPAAAFQDVFA